MDIIKKIKSWINSLRDKQEAKSTKLLSEDNVGYVKDEYYDQYLKDKESVNKDVKIAKEALEIAMQDYERFKRRDFSKCLPQYQSQLEVDEDEYRKALNRCKDEVQRWKYAVYQNELKLQFIRPNSKSDINERKKIEKEIEKRIRDADPKGVLNLRFHGTPIYFAKEIIKSRGIFSSRDRLNGFVSSTNDYNKISVTSLDNVDYFFEHGMPYNFTFHSMWAMDIEGYKYKSCPAGCLFVLIPRDKEESDMIASGQMRNVDFTKTPEALYAVMTTTENIKTVKLWMKKSGLDSSKVYTMDGLVEKVKLDVWKKTGVQEKGNESKMMTNHGAEEQGDDDSLVQ